MDITDREILDSAFEDQAPEVTVEEPVAEVVEETGQTRDEHGRFAPKEQPEPVAEAKPAAEAPKDEAFVPSWRLREMREEREAAERRFAESQSQWQRQIAELQSRAPMAVTTVQSNNKLIKFTHRRSTASTCARTCSRPTWAPTLNSIIRIRMELKAGGEQMNIPLVTRLTGAGVSTGTLVGNEEQIDNYGMRVWLEWAATPSSPTRRKPEGLGRHLRRGQAAAVRLGQGAAARRD
jgi:hypothetical protein